MAVRAGLLTRAQLRNRNAVVPVLHDVYRPAGSALTHELKCRAAGLLVPEGTVLTGPSLATVRGAGLAGPDDDVTMVITGRAAPEIDGVSVRVASRGPLSTAAWYGIPVATPHRMAFDLVARRPLEEGVAALDAAARAGLVDLDAFSAWLTGRHDDDVVAARAAAALADRRAESPRESVCRVRLVLAGYDVVPQVEVWNGRRFVARVDLALVALRIAIEYDGAWHGDGAQVVRDRERLNRLREAGWVVVHVTAATLRRPGALVEAVRAAVEQRSASAA